MDLSQSVTDGLRVLNDTTKIPDKIFTNLVGNICESLLTSKNDKIVIQGVTPLVLKIAYATLSSLILECAKLNTEAQDLSAILAGKLSDERIKIVSSIYEENKEKYRSRLSRIAFTHPRIVDVTWQLQHCIKDTYSGKVSQPTYIIELKLMNESGKLEPFLFHCSKSELQDLVGKLQDACKSLERVTS